MPLVYSPNQLTSRRDVFSSIQVAGASDLPPHILLSSPILSVLSMNKASPLGGPSVRLIRLDTILNLSIKNRHGIPRSKTPPDNNVIRPGKSPSLDFKGEKALLKRLWRKRQSQQIMAGTYANHPIDDTQMVHEIIGKCPQFRSLRLFVPSNIHCFSRLVTSMNIPWDVSAIAVFTCSSG